MSLNKCIYDFHLLAEGWLSTPPREEDALEAAPPADSVASVRMTEFSSDDKPDIWYKAEISSISANHDQTKSLVKKYGLPKAILVNCSAQKEELHAKLLSY